MNARAMAALRRKLETAELEHLRALCLDLHTQLEQVTNERDHAEQAAEFWREYTHELQAELWETTDKTVAITKSGTVHIVKKEAA